MATDILPAPSALQKYIQSSTSSESPHPPHLQHLALQIKHNLQYQHRWTELRIHHYQPHDVAPTGSKKRKRNPLPRPLISGLPPRRLYVHPDEQIAMLQAAKKQSTNGTSHLTSATGDQATRSEAEQQSTGAAPVNGQATNTTAADLAALTRVEPEREWVLPTHLKEPWSLKRFGEIFDGIGVVPPEVPDDGAENDLDDTAGIVDSGRPSEWRTKKRLLLATLDDDSTVVYYIVHDGVVKPRQN